MIAPFFLDRFERVQPSGNGHKASCPCPGHAHGDRNQSLSIFRHKTKPRWCIKCHKGHSLDEILAAVGLDWKDILDDAQARMNGTGPRWNRDDAQRAMANRGVTVQTLAHFHVTADLKAQAWRFPTGNGARAKLKSFHPGKQKYWYATDDTRPIPSVYHLKPLNGKPEAWIVEGEPDAWIMHQADLPACSLTSGANGNPSEEAVETLLDADVQTWHILYDHDDPGRETAKALAQALEAAGHPDVRLYRWPERTAPGFDVTDLFGECDRDPEAFRQTLESMEPVQVSTPQDNSSFSSFVSLSGQETREADQWATWPKPMEMAAFHGPFGEFLQEVETETEASLEGMLAQLLVAMGCAVGRGIFGRVSKDLHHLNEFVILVGKTAQGRKGLSWGVARSLILDATAKADDPAFRHCITSGLSTGEGLIKGLSDPFENESRPIPDKLCLVYCSEYASVLRVIKRQTNILTATLRDAWDGADLRVKTRIDPLEALDTHVSLIGHITPTELIRNLDRTEAANGFLNRHLLVAVKSSRLLPDGGQFDPKKYEEHVGMFADAITWGRKPREYTRSLEAAKRWKKYYPALKQSRPGLVGEVLSRGEPHVLRLSMIYAMADRATTIEVEHLEAAMAFYRYVEDTVRCVFDGVLGDRHEERVLTVLREAGEPLLTKAISSLVGNNILGLTAILRSLASQGLVEPGTKERQPGTRGRPGILWRAVTASVYETNERNEEIGV